MYAYLPSSSLPCTTPYNSLISKAQAQASSASFVLRIYYFTHELVHSPMKKQGKPRLRYLAVVYRKPVRTSHTRKPYACMHARTPQLNHRLLLLLLLLLSFSSCLSLTDGYTRSRGYTSACQNTCPLRNGRIHSANRCPPIFCSIGSPPTSRSTREADGRGQHQRRRRCCCLWSAHLCVIP